MNVPIVATPVRKIQIEFRERLHCAHGHSRPFTYRSRPFTGRFTAFIAHSRGQSQNTRPFT